MNALNKQVKPISLVCKNGCQYKGGGKKQGGFIITLELILLITILVIGTLVGIVAIRDALFKQYVSSQSDKTIVADDNGIPLGEAIDYDEHDAPRIFYIDRSEADNKRVLIGVRDDRFTSREPLYYRGASCQGDPCIKTTSDEATDNVGIDGVVASGSVSYFNALQGFPNYGVGRSENGLPGRLYRETPQQCDINQEEIGSRWVSQKVVTGEPCELFNLEITTEAAYTNCLVNTLEPCSCPPTYPEDQGDILANQLPAIEALLDTTIGIINPLLLLTGVQLEPVEVGTLCCPAGMEVVDDGGLVGSVVFTLLSTVVAELPPLVQGIVNPILAPLGSTPECRSVYNLKAAEDVPDPNGVEENVLDVFTAPFSVNLPVDAYSDEWISTPPPGEGNAKFGD